MTWTRASPLPSWPCRLHVENLQPQPREVIERAGLALELAQNRASDEVAI